MDKEKWYIRKRKWIAFGNSLCFYMCRVFPVHKNRISVCTFEGKGGFGCNPKYIVLELHKRRPDLEIIWLVNDMTKEFPDYIKKVPNSLWSRAYWLSTSKIWIDNYRKPYGTRKRKGQFYINTWHANIGFKSIGLWRGDAFSKMAYLVSKNDSRMIDRVVIDSKFCEKLFRKGLLYDGEYLFVGQPRCDILHGDRTPYKQQLREKYSLSAEAKIVMFAPTFKETSTNGKRSVYLDQWSIDFPRMLSTLEKKFGSQWYLFVRLHPQIAREGSQTGLTRSMNGRVSDVSLEDDMYELLAGVDAFVTDYSSAAFDACCCGIPVFVYADDLKQYQKARGSLLWDFPEDHKEPVRNNKAITPGIDVTLPFPIAHNNDELNDDIRSFDEKKYVELIERFRSDTSMAFEGKASKQVVDYIDVNE